MHKSPGCLLADTSLRFCLALYSAGGFSAILEFESCQAAWRQCEAHLLALTPEPQFPVTLAFFEFQLTKGTGITDIFPVITDEDISHGQTLLVACTVRLHLLHHHARVHGVPVLIEEQQRCLASEVVVGIAFH